MYGRPGPLHLLLPVRSGPLPFMRSKLSLPQDDLESSLQTGAQGPRLACLILEPGGAFASLRPPGDTTAATALCTIFPFPRGSYFPNLDHLGDLLLTSPMDSSMKSPICKACFPQTARHGA